MAKAQATSNPNLFIVFWLGLLTGVIIFGSLFAYKAYNATSLEDAILRIEKIETSLDITTGDTKEGIWGPGM